MAKVSPIVRSFNGGIFSALMEGRTDLDRYPASMRAMVNMVAAPQGPAICRSGSYFKGEQYSHETPGEFVPFVFNEDEGLILEFADNKLRIFSEDGLLIEPKEDCTIDETDPAVVFTSADLDAEVGDQVVFQDVPTEYNINNIQSTITAKDGDEYTISLPWPTGLSIPTGVSVAKVFSINSPYGHEQVSKLRYDQSLDVLYLTNLNGKPYKLGRRDTYDWFFEAIEFIDGPYMDAENKSTTLTPSSTGKATPDMTANGAPSGTAFANGGTAWHAFDNGEADTYWESTADQTGQIGYEADTAFVCDGYAIHIHPRSTDVSYTAKNYAPETWTFEGSNDGSNWDVLDQQITYVAYDGNKSGLFRIDNETAYTHYRLNISAVGRNGTLHPRVRTLVLRSAASADITFTASSAANINNGEGFKATDVGRLMRVKSSDNAWRSLVIKTVTSATEIVATLKGEPLASLKPIRKFKLGYWSDTTGYPNYVTFAEDRLWFGGSDVAKALLVGSVEGDYENMQQTTELDEVLDTSAIVVKLNSRKNSRIKWVEENDRGLLVGTGYEEYLISSTEGSRKNISATSVKATKATRRGSSDTKPALIDNQVLYVQRSGRTLREYAYSFEQENFKSPNMSLLASHLGIEPFVQMAYAAEPFSIVWVRRQNGSLVGLTYNRDENVVGWHEHEFEGGVVETMAVIPSRDGLQDILFLGIKRVVNGEERRYVEMLTRFWDFDMVKEDAIYVDSALQYDGPEVAAVYGLSHLEGEEVYGLADGTPIGPITVTNGKAELELEASRVTLGLGYESFGEISRLENGAADGTAMGKEKRINNYTALLWNSQGGEFGRLNEDTGEVEYTPVNYEIPLNEITDISLFDGFVGPVVASLGYGKEGTVFFRRKKGDTLPFNLVALMPQMHTYDR